MRKTEQIPKNWRVVKLGDFAVYQKGKKPKKVEKTHTKFCPLPYVNIKAFEKGLVDEYTDGDGCVLCDDNDFLMVWDGARAGYVGKAIKGALGSTLVKISFPGINQDYAYYFLQSKYLQINTKAKGTGIPHVDPNLLWNYDFPIPPLSEQDQIVAKIEELFSNLDKGIERLKATQQQLKIYRQSVLKWAFEGRLTNSIVKEGELPQGWKLTKLENMAVKITDGEHFRPKTQEDGIPFLSAKDVLDTGVSFESPLYISEKTAKKAMQRCNPSKGDILIVSRGATVGRMCIVDTDKVFCLLGSVILIKVHKKIESKLLRYFLSSPAINQLLISISGSTAQQAIYLRDIKNLDIPLPPLDRQQIIISEIESRLSICDELEQNINQGLQQAEALRQSILKKAFEGKLVPYEPKD